MIDDETRTSFGTFALHGRAKSLKANIHIYGSGGK